MRRPTDDGVNHINIYTGAATQLGRDLSNLAPIGVTVDGLDYASVEAYWYWLGCAPLSPADDRHLRSLSGLEAKRTGKALRQRYPGQKRPDFELLVKRAIRLKVTGKTSLALELARSSLPLAHYYVRSGEAIDAGFEWVTQANDTLRRQLRPLLETRIEVINVSVDQRSCDYVGRTFAGRSGSPLANPFPVAGKGQWSARADQACAELLRAGQMVTEVRATQAARGAPLGEAVSLYRAWLKLRLAARGEEYQAVRELAQRVLAGEQIRLGCWCAPRPCHAEVITRAVENMVFSARLSSVRKVKE